MWRWESEIVLGGNKQRWRYWGGFVSCPKEHSFSYQVGVGGVCKVGSESQFKGILSCGDGGQVKSY